MSASCEMLRLGGLLAIPSFLASGHGLLPPDWMLDDNDPDGVVRRFMKGEGEEEVQRLRSELRSLLDAGPSDGDVEQALGPFYGYDPRFDGYTPREWVEHLVVLLGEPEHPSR